METVISATLTWTWDNETQLVWVEIKLSFLFTEPGVILLHKKKEIIFPT